MESMGPARVYQDFEPSMEWVPEDDSDTLLVYLPGFAKEQLRVQLRARNLIISGERKLQQNTWSRFRVEFPVSVNCDLNKISAKFEGNILFVRQPKHQPEVAAGSVVPAAAVDDENNKPTTAASVIQLPTPQIIKPPPMGHHHTSNDDDQKTLINKPNIEDDQPQLAPVPKMMGGGLPMEEKLNSTTTTAEEAVNEETIAPDHAQMKTSVNTELDKTTKKALDNYKRAVGVFAAKLKTSRNAVNTVVILLVGLLIGMYLSNSFKSWTKP